MDRSSETITVIGPSARNPDGTVKFTHGPREIPRRQWENPDSRTALVAIGIRPLDETLAPSEEKRGPGRPSTTAKALKEANAQIEELRAEMEILKSKQPTKETTDADQ